VLVLGLGDGFGEGGRCYFHSSFLCFEFRTVNFGPVSRVGSGRVGEGGERSTRGERSSGDTGQYCHGVKLVSQTLTVSHVGGLIIDFLLKFKMYLFFVFQIGSK
jgi:hypothetical protein